MLTEFWPLALPTLRILAALLGLFALALTLMVMSRLDRRTPRHLRWPTLGGALCHALLFGFGRQGFGPDGGYASVTVALVVAGLAWIVREWGPSNPASSSARQRATRPAVVFLSMSVLLLGLLWAVSAAVRSASPLGPPVNVPHGVSTTGAIDIANLSRFLVVAAAAGLVAMTSIQGVRTILPVRGAFHRAAMERWLGESDRALSLLAGVASVATADTGSSRYAFFDLPIEQLCGQIAAGADRLLDDPSGQSASLAPPSPNAGNGVAPATPAELLKALAADDRDVDAFVALAASVGEHDTREFVRARTGLSLRIQRNIDRLQIDTAFWWKRVLRGLALAICGAIGLEALGGDGVAAILCAFVGGFIAAVARDLVAIVEKLRR